MAFLLKLISASKTIDFLTEANGYILVDGGFTLSAPENVETWSDPSTAGGRNLLDYRTGNRTAAIHFDVGGSSRLILNQRINAISAMLTDARNFALGKAQTPVQLQYSWDDATYSVYLPVLGGALHMPENVMSLEQQLSTYGPDAFQITDITLELSLGPTGYGTSLVSGSPIEIPLTNRNGTRVLGGINVADRYNSSSATPEGVYQDNFVDIAGSDILGDAPGMVKLIIKNIVLGTGMRLNRIMAGMTRKKANMPMLTYDFCDRPVRSTYYNWAWTDVSGIASAYKGNYRVITGTNVDSTPFPLDIEGLISIPNPERFSNEYYKLILKSSVNVVPERPVQVKALLINGPHITVWDSGWVDYDSSVNSSRQCDMGVLRLPHAKSPGTMNGAYSLEWWFRVADGTTGNIQFAYDCWEMIPVQEGLRSIVTFPVGVGQSSDLIDDPWNNMVYRYCHNDGYDYHDVYVEYLPLKVIPGVDMRVVFREDGAPFTNPDGDYITVQMFYIPTYAGVV